MVNNDSAAAVPEVDVAIVGGGAAGLCYAAELGEAGKRVHILESGPRWELNELISSQIWARRLKWRGAPIVLGGSHRFGHNMATGSGLGGAALHHYAGWPRLREDDFKSQSKFGKGRDWPIEYSDLRPYYDRIQAEFGLSGDGERELGRPPSDPYPMPPLVHFDQVDVLAKGFQKLGLHPSPSAMAINSTEYRGRPPCLYDGWCDAGCPIGALANPLVVHLPRVEKAGVKIDCDCTVIRVNTDEQGRARELVYRDPAGQERRLRAKLIILAASTVENSRLLLNSASERWPSGLGNGNGMVGKYFACHSMVNIYAMFPQKVNTFLGVTAGQWLAFDRYVKNPGGRPFGSYIWGFGTALKPNDLLGIANTRPELLGPALDRFIRQGKDHLAVIMAECETVPNANNRILLDREHKDRFGQPLAKVDHSLDKEAVALWEHARDEGLEIVKAAGAEDSWASPLFMSHPLGGTVMGKEPADSVVDSYGRSHQVPNLFIAGGGLFPSVGALGPTFTIYALSLRSAEYINKNWKSLTQ